MCFFAIVSRAQKISTVVDTCVWAAQYVVSRAQKISTVVDLMPLPYMTNVSRAQKISTVVDTRQRVEYWQSFTRSKNFYCCRF